MQADPSVANMARQLAERANAGAYWDGVFAWGYTAYFILFALGAAALLLHVLLPRRPDASGLRAHSGLLGLILLLFLLAISQQMRIDEKRGFIADQEKRYEAAIRKLSKGRDKDEVLRAQYLYMPRGDSLKYISLGNTSLAADYLWLTSLQYVTSAFRRGQKFEMLTRFYDAMLELDPHWTEAAINAGKVLSALEQDRLRVEVFYMRAILNNPDDVRLYYEAGRLFVVPPLNRKQQKQFSQHAVAWFQRALDKLARKKNPGELDKKWKREIEDLVARLGLEGEYYLVADEMLYKHATNPENPEATRMVAARDWLGAHSLVLANKLQSLVGRYKEARGAFPASLEALLDALPDKGRALRSDPFGYPNDAYGFPLEYDPATGLATSRGVNARRALQVGNVVNNLLGVYLASYGSPPADLAELSRFCRAHFASPNHAPSPVITDAVGVDFNCETGPLGPWEYDPVAGLVKLPPYCEVGVLFRNAANVVPPAP